MRAERMTRGLLWRRGALALALCSAVAGAYFWSREAPLVSAIEGQTLTWRFLVRGPALVPPVVAIAAIDDRTVAALKRWPVPRRAIAEAIARMSAAGAAVIGIDLMFVEREQPSDGIGLSPGDMALREALGGARGAVLSVAFTFAGDSDLSADDRDALRGAAYRVVRSERAAPAADLLKATGALVPIEPLRHSASLGHVNVPVDPDGTLRHVPLAVGFEDQFVPALPVETARQLLGLAREDVVLQLGRGLLMGDRDAPTDPILRLPLAYYGPSGSVPTHSLIDIIGDRVPAALLAGRAVLIGATATGVGDTFVAPYSRTLPGVELLATAVANLAEGHIVDRGASAVLWDVAAIFALGLLACLLAHLPGSGVAALVALGLIAAWGAAAQVAFNERLLWLSLLFPSLSVLVNAGTVGISRFARERRLRRDVERQRGNLARYHSPVIAERLAKGAAEFSEQEQPAAILFVDLAGYTRRSERMHPAETVRFLRRFHGAIERPVLAHGGMLEQFTGDGAMVVFGVGGGGPANAAAALACAYDLLTAINELSGEMTRAGAEPLRIGIGIHYGPVVIGRVGGERQYQLTATGDTVNVASRLEALTRVHGAAIIVSDAAVAAVRAAGDTDLLSGLTALAPQPIRGRGEPVRAWIAAGSAPAPGS